MKVFGFASVLTLLFSCKKENIRNEQLPLNYSVLNNVSGKLKQIKQFRTDENFELITTFIYENQNVKFVNTYRKTINAIDSLLIKKIEFFYLTSQTNPSKIFIDDHILDPEKTHFLIYDSQNNLIRDSIVKIQYPNNLVAVNSFQYLNESIFRNFTQLYLGSFQDVTNKIEFFDGNIILSNTIFQAMYNNNEEKEEFSYDNKINPLAQMNIASIYNIIQQNSPVYGYGKFNTISKNNVIKIKITDTWNSGIRYEYLTHQYSNNNYLIHSVYQDMSSSTYKIDYYYY